MRQLFAFLKATLIGGVLYLVPIVVLLVILGKAIQIANRIAPPLINLVERVGLGHILTPQVVSILILFLFCLAAGLFARTRVAKRIGAYLEDKILMNLPGYSMLKSIGESAVGVNASGIRDAVMVRIEDAWQVAFIVDQLADGLLAVYVPGVPDCRSGSLYFMTRERVKALDIPVECALKIVRRMGVGSSQFFRDGIEAGPKP